MFANNTRHYFHVKTTTLLAVAGCVWLLAGFNIVRLGLIAYTTLSVIKWWHILLSCVVFFCFGKMFYSISHKHITRIVTYQAPTKPIWQFFNKKAYLIMAIMMGGGMYIRYSGLAPDIFIAVFYTGLGCALFLAGVLFLQHFIKHRCTDSHV